MTDFDPLTATLGGCLIGLAAVLLMFLNGRIAGISGIAGGLLATKEAGGRIWRFAFVTGLLVAPLIWVAMAGKQPDFQISNNLVLIGIAGLLVGTGSALGSGCTSGHGICGMARVSKRSIAATVIFMVVAIVTVFVVRHLIGGN